MERFIFYNHLLVWFLFLNRLHNQTGDERKIAKQVKPGKPKGCKAADGNNLSRDGGASRLPIIQSGNNFCDFKGYDAYALMKETSSLRSLITKRGTLEILLPLCCATDSVRYIKFKKNNEGFQQQNPGDKTKGAEKKRDFRQAGLQRDPIEGGIQIIDVQGTGISRVHF